MSLVERFGAELADRIAITGTRALVLGTAGQKEESRGLEQALRGHLERESARIRSPLLRLRQRRVSDRLLAAVLSPVGPVYPRVTLEPPEVGGREAD